MNNRINKHLILVLAIFCAITHSAMSQQTISDTDSKTSLTISDGTQFVPQDFYPKFSWDETPMYYMFGNQARVLTPEEVSFISERTDFLCIEKSHALNELGSADLGAKHERVAFKKLKPESKVLFYFNSAYAWSFTSYNKGFKRSEIDKHPELKKFLIVDDETGELAHRSNTFYFDVLNPDFRQWWVETVAKGVEESGCDGAFIDQMHGFNFLRPDKAEEVQLAMGEMMTNLKKAIGPDKILLGNNAHQKLAQYVFPAVDAIMFEHYKKELVSKESLLSDWDNMLKIAKAGKMSIFRIGVEVEKTEKKDHPKKGKKKHKNKEQALHQDSPSEMLAKARLEYYQACFLIGAQPYSYFQYGWGWRLSTGSLIDFPALKKPLGSPQGAYARTSPEGWQFTREFEHASVWVDTEKGEAKITWK